MKNIVLILNRVHKIIALFISVVLIQTAFAANEVTETNIDMFSGEVTVLGTFDIERIAIGNGSIIRVEVKDEGEIIVIAQKSGSSSLRMWHKDGAHSSYNFRVSENDPQTRVRMETMVRMSVKMVEVRKSALKDVGINWADTANGPGGGIAADAISNGLFRVNDDPALGKLPLNVKPFSSHFGLSTSLTSQLNFLATSGDAVTLAEPTLSCVNGGVAKFLAGGELPYPVTGANGQVSVEFKEYGIKLNISPRVDDSGNIYTSVMTEISQIDPAVTVLGAPGILSRKAETQMNIVAGETIVLSGLLSAESSRDTDKIPGLGDLPILGNLFRSKSYRNNMTELVIFVTPEIIEPQKYSLTEREERIYNYGVDRLSEIKEKLNFDLMD